MSTDLSRRRAMSAPGAMRAAGPARTRRVAVGKPLAAALISLGMARLTLLLLSQRERHTARHGQTAEPKPARPAHEAASAAVVALRDHLREPVQQAVDTVLSADAAQSAKKDEEVGG
jgi:hypothetical protein